MGIRTDFKNLFAVKYLKFVPYCSAAEVPFPRALFRTLSTRSKFCFNLHRVCNRCGYLLVADGGDSRVVEERIPLCLTMIESASTRGVRKLLRLSISHSFTSSVSCERPSLPLSG